MKTTRFFGMLALGLLAAACSKGPGRVASLPAPVAATAIEIEIDRINDLLLRGETGNARKRIKAVLKRDPMNASVQLLSDSVERDPKDLLGPESYPHVVRAGETIGGLAQRLLGNRLKAYQLARYNGLAAPYVLVPGQTLRIPGTPPRVEPVRRPDPAPSRPAPSTSAPAPRPATPKAANPVAARQLRTAGLAALNQGKVARAVALLRRAAAADPGNPVIARDLARAERIATTVRAAR